MTAVGFLLILFCLAFLLAWIDGLLRSPNLGQRQRRRQPPTPPRLDDSQPRLPGPSSSVPQTLEQRERGPQTQDRAPQPPVSKPRVLPKLHLPANKVAVRLPSVKHLRNVREAEYILKSLRLQAADVEDKLPLVIGSLRRISPYVFEELLLSCCQDQGWQICRNFRYSCDGGNDGRVAMVKDRP